MRELVIISGKGGTGKTSITAAFASFAENAILCDADVDAADLHLLTQPTIIRREAFMGGGIAHIKSEKCSSCGECRQLCRFEAISEHFIVDPIRCEGCGVCVDLCPQEAIDFPIQKCGEWFISNTRFGKMVHARLGIAEENSGKLVSLIRKEAAQLAHEHDTKLIVTDGPPGIGCPVIASITGATALLIVVEPTVSGVHDMERVLDLASHFKVPSMICINKSDLNKEMSKKIEQFAIDQNITLVGRIPFDPDFTLSMVQGLNIFEFRQHSQTVSILKDIWERIMESSAMIAPKSFNMASIN